MSSSPTPTSNMHSSNESMSRPAVTIIGAGIGGLTLGRCLARRGIPYVLYERDSHAQATKRHNYAITLRKAAFEPLLGVLELGLADFRQRVAVIPDAQHGDSMRVNRRKLEALLQESLDVKWEYPITDLKQSREGPCAVFESGEEFQSRILVGADGPHSLIRRSISPQSAFDILPYVAINGKRRINRQIYDREWPSKDSGSAVIDDRVDRKLFRVSVDEIEDTRVSISYTYSRAATPDDPLFQPNRPNSGAKDIPEEFFEELAARDNLEGYSKVIFDPKLVRQDRLLSWLMRSVLVPEADMEKAAAGGIVLMGDAAHHAPILGSDGANEAILDAVALADQIVENGVQALPEFHRSRNEVWRRHVKEGVSRLAEMHGVGSAGSRPSL